MGCAIVGFKRFAVGQNDQIAKACFKPLKTGVSVLPQQHRVDILTQLDAVADIVPDWQELADTDPSRHSRFLAPHWVMSWLGSDEPVFAAVWEDGVLNALMPMAKTGTAFGTVNVLQLATDESSTYGVPLLARNNHEKYLSVIVEKIREEKTADILKFGRVYGDISVLADCFVQTPSEAGYASALDLKKDLENVGKRRSVYLRTKKETRQKLKKLAAADRLEFAVVTAKSETARKLVNMGLKWKQIRLKRLGRIGQNVSSPQYQQKLKQVCSGEPVKEAESLLFYLLLNDKPVAMSLHLRDEEALYSHFSAFEPDCGYFSPGTVLFGHVLDWMQANDVMRYDFMGYPEVYKARFSNETVALNDYTLALTGKGRLASAFMRMPFKAAIKSVFYALPLPFRRLVVAMV